MDRLEEINKTLDLGRSELVKDCDEVITPRPLSLELATAMRGIAPHGVDSGVHASALLVPNGLDLELRLAREAVSPGSGIVPPHP
ncbi:MAG: hypothetical protein NVV63_02330 [Opitutus sp.]|nr:hypothetical protein [Opitutus sp.]